MTTTRGLGSTTSYNGGSARWEGLEDRGPKTVDVRDLPNESQAAHEILKTLKVADPKGRARLLQAAQLQEPVTQRGLAAVAELFFRLEMPLTNAGIQRFKAERGLGGGPAVAGPVARAYARAVDGGEVLFRVAASEESGLRPADKACLTFLRGWSRVPGTAELVGRLKEALDLGNPDVGAAAAALANEYVGASTVREVSKASSTRNCDLTPEGMLRLIEILEAEKARSAPSASTMPAAMPATSPASTPFGRMPVSSPTTSPASTPSTLPPKFMGSPMPAAMVQSTAPRSPQSSPASSPPLTPPRAPAPSPQTSPQSRPPAASPQTLPPRMPASSPTTSPVTSTGLRRRPT